MEIRIIDATLCTKKYLVAASMELREEEIRGIIAIRLISIDTHKRSQFVLEIIRVVDMMSVEKNRINLGDVEGLFIIENCKIRKRYFFV